MSKGLATLILGLGALLVIGALVLALVVVPAQKVFPEDVDVTRHYNVAYLTLLDPETMTFYRAAEGENPNLRIDRHVTVEAVDGNVTLVREEQALMDGDQQLNGLTKHYALDRQTLEPTDDFPAEWAENVGYWAREGVVIGWPIGAKKRDYQAWSDDYRDTVLMDYQGEVVHAGINTYHYISGSEAQLIDPAQVATLGLPTQLTISSLGSLAAGMDIEDPELRQQVTTLLPLMIQLAVQDAGLAPAEGEIAVPLVYYFSYEGDYWVEPTTGVLIDTRKAEVRAVTFPEEVITNLKTRLDAMGRDSTSIDRLLPLVVNEFEYQGTPESVEEAKADAQESIDRITLFGTTLPAAMLIAGGLLGIAAAVGARRK